MALAGDGNMFCREQIVGISLYFVIVQEKSKKRRMNIPFGTRNMTHKETVASWSSASVHWK